MTCFTLLMAALLQQTPAAGPEISPVETWNQVQQRYSSAGVVGFRAEGRVLSTRPAYAGRTVAQISANVAVARSGFGSVEVTVQTGLGDEAKISRVSSLGTEEGVFAVDCEENFAYSCGDDWATSGELDDFAFLGPAWSAAAARAGAPSSVHFVPAHAEHPGLQGLRVRWGKPNQPATTTIFWLDSDGFVSSADVRLDAETVLHWNFSNCQLSDEQATPLQAVALPAGCKRDSGQAVEAAAPPAETVEPEPVVTENEDPDNEDPE